jgi:hypothetical protein
LRWIWLALAVVGGVMIAWGMQLGRHDAVLHQAKILCTACIGLE